MSKHSFFTKEELKAYCKKHNYSTIKGVLHKKCSTCCVDRITKDFENIKGDEVYKTCIKCRDYSKEYQKQKKEQRAKEEQNKKKEPNTAELFVSEVLKYRTEHNEYDEKHRDWRLRLRVTADNLYKFYESWCNKNGDRPLLTKNKFTRSIRTIMYLKGRTSKGIFYQFPNN